MKRFVMICLAVILMNTICHAENKADFVGIGSLISADATDFNEEVWEELKHGCSHILSFDGEELTSENGGLYKNNDTIYLKNCIKEYNISTIERLFDFSLYKQILEDYNSHQINIRELIYDEKISRVFVLTDDDVYVITWHRELTNDEFDNIEVLSFKKWQEKYIDFIPSKLIVGKACMGSKAFIGKTTSYIPLRVVFENIGATIVWDNNTYEVIIDDRFILKLDNGTITGVDLEDDWHSPLQLQDWTNWCRYSIHHNHIYLDETAMKYLLEYFGYNVDINIPQGEISVFQDVGAFPLF